MLRICHKLQPAWVLTATCWPRAAGENKEKLIPDLKELMSSLPAGTPIIIFCPDNSCFLAATEV
jgi:hypothetical protein